LSFVWSRSLLSLNRQMLCVFFFSSRRRHTRWPRDWSSVVCSSHLENALAVQAEEEIRERIQLTSIEDGEERRAADEDHRGDFVEIGRASCRERVYISVRAV